MSTCVICNKEVTGGAFSTKDKFELMNHSYICKECAAKIGIKNIFSAAAYTAEKAKKKYFELYPEEQDMRRGKEDLDNDYILELLSSNRRLEAQQYVKEVAGLGSNDAMYYIDKIKKDSDEEFVAKIKALPNSDTMFTKKEILYLRTVLHEGEEVLSVVSGIMQQNDVNVSRNTRETAAKSKDNTRTWLMALTDKRIILIDRHMLVGTEHIEIPLTMINSISLQSRMFLSSISIMHGSGGIIIDNITKGCEKPFVDNANKAIEKAKMKPADNIVTAINQNNTQNGSIADELIKMKSLLDDGIITQEEFDSLKSKLIQ